MVFKKLGTLPVSRQFVILVVAVSSLITIFTTAIQLYGDYRSDLRSIDHSIAVIEKAHLPTIIQHVWTADDRLIQTQLNGLIRQRDITYIAINEQGAMSWEAGARKEDGVVEKALPLVRQYRGASVSIGSLFVQADLQIVYQRIWDKLLIVLLTNGVKTFLVSLFIIFIFSRLVGRPLEEISATVREKGLRSTSQAPLISTNAASKKSSNEIARLAEAINERQQEVHSALSELEDANWNLEQTTAALLKAKNDAEKANTTKSEFLASMSHELRTPLNAVLGYGQILQLDIDGTLSPKNHEHIQHVLDGGEQLLSLVDDLLDLARIEAHRVPLALETFDPSSPADQCIEQVEILAIEKNVEIKIEATETDRPTVWSDKNRFKQVLINLLTNAIKYNRPNGTVIVRYSVTKDDYYRTTVIDSGLGISQDKQPGIFQLFHRGNDDSTIATEGMGIGLAVSNLLVEKLGGRIGFYSEEGSGSTFWFDVPLTRNQSVLIWTDALRVGVDAIDRDHQVIFALTNRVSQTDLTHEEMAEIVHEMIAYTAYHFRREEAIMRACGYPNFENHCDYHKRLEDEIRKRAQNWLENDNELQLLELRQFLRDWWSQHILNIDTGIMSHARGKELQIAEALSALEVDANSR